MTWADEFLQRMNEFKASFPSRRNGVPVSIQLRVSGGSFHREHSRHAYQMIDEYLYSHPPDNFAFEEHESGPELLAYVSLITAGVMLTSSVIDFVTVIVKARSDGIRHGDRKSEPLELVMRAFDEHGTLREEKVLTIDPGQGVSRYLIEKALLSSANKMVPKNDGKKKDVINK